MKINKKIEENAIDSDRILYFVNLVTGIQNRMADNNPFCAGYQLASLQQSLLHTYDMQRIKEMNVTQEKALND